MRFKVDINNWGDSYVFALYFRRHWTWTKINAFKTREEASAFYEQVKDLPEYLP